MGNFSTNAANWPKQDKPFYRYHLNDNGTISVMEIQNYEIICSHGRPEYRFTQNNGIHGVKETDFDRVRNSYITSFTYDPVWAREKFYDNLARKNEEAGEIYMKTKQMMCAMSHIARDAVIKEEHK